MRRDAARRREALIQAAAECFSEHGYGVPLDLIAERANVGRATLYRNFSDRFSLALAIFDVAIDRAEILIGESPDLRAALGAMVRSGVQATALFNRLSTEMPLSGDNRRAFERLKARVIAIFQPHVEQARKDGTLRADITAIDVVMVSRMISGVIVPALSEEEIEAQVDTALDLIFQGLRPR